jgi:hypothetical protein
MVVELSTKFSTSSQSALRIELTDLQSTVEMLAASNRREFGKLWKRSEASPPPLPLPSNGHDADDKEFTAMVALQSASAPK